MVLCKKEIETKKAFAFIYGIVKIVYVNINHSNTQILISLPHIIFFGKFFCKSIDFFSYLFYNPICKSRQTLQKSKKGVATEYISERVRQYDLCPHRLSTARLLLKAFFRLWVKVLFFCSGFPEKYFVKEKTKWISYSIYSATSLSFHGSML